MAARLHLSHFWRDERGATAVEYGLIVGLVFIAMISGLSLFATNENVMYTKISTAIGGATH